jgi:DNA-binding MarR family transcriptional regulator
MRKTSTRRAAGRKKRAGYRLDEQIGFLLRCAYQRATGNLLSQISAHDLTTPQFATLARLYERGRVSQNLLGRLVAMEPANIRDVVLRLRKRRLVKSERAPDDARLTLVSLTRSGTALVEVLIPVEIMSTARTLATLKPGERKILFGFLRRIAED